MAKLAIDQSLVNSGITIKEKDGYTFENIKPPNKLKDVDRLRYIGQKLVEIIKAFDVDTVIMEGYSFGSRGRALISLGELGGVLKVLIVDMGLKLHIVAPTSLKKFVCGKGNAKKELMLMKIYKKWGKEFTDNNTADSFALMKYYEEILKK